MSGSVFSKKREHEIQSRLPFFFLGLFLVCGCGSLTVGRPVQEMSDTAAALRAAKEVNAETLAADLYRRANEAYLRARNEYRIKNFVVAKDYAARAKRLAEEAEFEALKQGAQRTSTLPTEDTPPPVPESYDYPTPRGTPGFLLGTESAPAPGASPPPPAAPN